MAVPAVRAAARVVKAARAPVATADIKEGMRMRWQIAHLLKLALLACILLALLAMLLQTDVLTIAFFAALRALFNAVMPCVIVIAGIYMLLKLLFR
jgi:fatty-acid desaturase